MHCSDITSILKVKFCIFQASFPMFPKEGTTIFKIGPAMNETAVASSYKMGSNVILLDDDIHYHVLVLKQI